MNIKELKELIADLPDDMEVIMQKDSEGNGFSPLAGGDSEAIYVAEKSWYGGAYSLSWSAEDADMEEEEWEEMKSRDKSLILYPVN